MIDAGWSGRAGSYLEFDQLIRLTSRDFVIAVDAPAGAFESLLVSGTNAQGLMIREKPDIGHGWPPERVIGTVQYKVEDRLDRSGNRDCSFCVGHTCLPFRVRIAEIAPDTYITRPCLARYTPFYLIAAATSLAMAFAPSSLAMSPKATTKATLSSILTHNWRASAPLLK